MNGGDKMDTKGKGQIRVTVQEVDRMAAITELAQAINKVASALSVTPSVFVTDNVFYATEADSVGMVIDTTPEVTETTVYEVGKDDDDD
jgi:hypothetical protein